MQSYHGLNNDLDGIKIPENPNSHIHKYNKIRDIDLVSAKIVSEFLE